ncbi:stage II sporulation protein M [Caldanaerobius polysaccharolyticus]|uniref:stage II sporulation protein M n=1 Tax=Caldanaerobius polysaccharolyticus TaxID=44256 RepID=UPI000479EFE8|nr:stage II sporulation protein M [Caldanaerobius polysaccharolyticus]
MPKKLGNEIRNSVRRHSVLYVICVICLAIGIATGSFSIKALDEGQKKDLIQYFNSFMQAFKAQNMDSHQILKISLQNNLIMSLVFWVSGATILGVPIIIILLLFKGFLIGYTVGFLIEGLYLKGIAISSVAVFPQNVFIVPGFIMLSVNGILFSSRIVKNKRAHFSRYREGFARYTITSMLIIGFIVIGSFVEAYLVPLLVKFAL